jgi:hypothetical protein
VFFLVILNSLRAEESQVFEILPSYEGQRVKNKRHPSKAGMPFKTPKTKNLTNLVYPLY